MSTAVQDSTNESIPVLTRKDFVSDQEVRWCPGCGDYSILAQMQKMLPDLGLSRENIVFVSGIGCSSRFPYYMETYGFHTIHGRALTIATGLKAARPDLTVFVITGDGDGLSIGGNHLLHAMRRNVDLNVILFNNRIYGLTKGQYSPTSELGKVTKSTPMGSVEMPLDPVRIALASGATFVARSADRDPKHLEETLYASTQHQGTSFVEVYQNCNIFNDGAFAGFLEKDVRDDRTIHLEHGEPMRFGKNKEHGIRINGVRPEVVFDAPDDADLLVHDAHREDFSLANLLADMQYPDFPVPLGVIRAVDHPTYDGMMAQQLEDAQARGGASFSELLAGPETWEVI